jgi:hypothetical protein
MSRLETPAEATHDAELFIIEQWFRRRMQDEYERLLAKMANGNDKAPYDPDSGWIDL